MTEPRPKPLKVYGRAHYACNRCKASKIKCSGENPCSNCKNLNKTDDCIYPKRDRKIVIMESDLNKLHERISTLEATSTGTSTRFDFQKHELIQERLNEKNQEFLFNSIGLENFLLSDDANDIIKWMLIKFINKRLPSKDVAYKLIDRVIDHYAHEFYLIDVESYGQLVENVYALFEAYNSNDEVRSKELNNRVKRYQLCYFFILIAYGEQMAHILPNQEENPGLQFYLVAAELLNLTHEVVGFEFIQSALLMALYSANLNRYNTVYNYFGVAIRSAISQEFHRQGPSPDPANIGALITQEKRKRLWWTVFVTDATWTAKLNLPSQIEYTETDVDLPGENVVDLNDLFDSNILEVNVHLAKYISRSVEKIYGANIRTFSVNYINTDQFNEKTLMINVVTCLKDLIKDFEIPYLFQYKNCNIIEDGGRKLVNLFLRFNLLVTVITKPLISYIFKKNQFNLLDNPVEIEDTVNKAITCSVCNINILLKLYEIDRIFTTGFFDSQYLFTSIVILIMSSITDSKCLEIINKAIALLNLMASSGNINAENCMKKLWEVNEYLSRTELGVKLNFNLDIKSFVTIAPQTNFNSNDYYYNPYDDISITSLSDFKLLKNIHVNRQKHLITDTQRTLMYNPNHELQNQQLHEQLKNSSSAVDDTFFSSEQQVNSDFPKETFHNYEEFSMSDVFTNNRVQNLSDASQTLLVNLMNNIQSREFMNM